jgi:Hint domain
MSLTWYDLKVYDVSSSVVFDGYMGINGSSLITHAYNKTDLVQDILFVPPGLFIVDSSGDTTDNLFTGSPLYFSHTGTAFYFNILEGLPYTVLSADLSGSTVIQSVTGYDSFDYSGVKLKYSNYWFMVTPSGPPCYNKGTKILCENDQYLAIENLKQGTLVKTFSHGLKKIKYIGKNMLINNQTKWQQSMYKMKKTNMNNLTEDLIVTGWHSVLVDEYTDGQLVKMQEYKIPEQTLDGKKLLVAAVNDEFEQIQDTNVYTYYHLVLEHDGDQDRRYGIYANGVLSETISENDFLKKMM